MTLTLRARVALLTGTLVLVVAALVALGGYLTMRSSLLSRASHTAQAEASRLAALVETPSGNAQGQNNQVDITDPTLTRQLGVAGALIEVRRPGGALVQASNPSGLRSEPGSRRGRGRPSVPPLPRSLLAGCLRSGGARARLGRPPVALACHRIGSASAPVGVVAVGMPLSDTFASLATLRDALLLAVLGGAAVSAGLALAAARRATRPIRRIAQTAQTIRAGDLGKRIGYRGRDELGELARLLDACFAELEQSLARQRRFGADASHELRTPLASIRANVDLLRRWANADPAAREQAIASLDQASSRAARLIEDLLYLATIEREPPAAHAPVRLDRVVLAVVRESSQLRGEVRIEVARLDEATVIGDEQRLQQLLLNVLDNALRVSPPSGVVTIALAVDGPIATVSVADRGPGIEPQALGRIFDRLYSDRKGSGEGGGSGLGLSIARAIAHAHGGELTARNNAAAGATFTLALPLAPAGPRAPTPAPAMVSGSH